MALGAQQLWRWGWSKRWEKCFEPLRNHQKIAGLGSWVAKGGLGWSLPISFRTFPSPIHWQLMGMNSPGHRLPLIMTDPCMARTGWVTPFLGADFSSSKCYDQLVTSLYFNLISSAPSQLHTFILSPDFFKKMMAINLDLLLPSAPKKCPNCRTKKNIFFFWEAERWRRRQKRKGWCLFYGNNEMMTENDPSTIWLDGGEIWFIFHIQTELRHFLHIFFSIETGSLMNSIICNAWGVEQTLCFGLVKQVRIRKMHLLRVLNGKKKWSDVRYD